VASLSVSAADQVACDRIRIDASRAAFRPDRLFRPGQRQVTTASAHRRVWHAAIPLGSTLILAV